MTFRTLRIGDDEWGYFVGRGNVVVRAPDGKKTIADFSTVTGRDPNVIERGQWKRTSDGMVKPSDVRAYIERQTKEEGGQLLSLPVDECDGADR